jgi:hypothetical protein
MSSNNTQQVSDQQPAKSTNGLESVDNGTSAASVSNPNKFDASLIKKYPRSTRKVSMRYGAYSISADESSLESTLSMHISPHGIEFQTTSSYSPGTLLRIHLDIPDYRQRKLRFVQYRRIDQPARFPILAKVVSVQDVGRRGKKKIVTVQTVNIDETDELVLKSYLQEG